MSYQSGSRKGVVYLVKECKFGTGTMLLVELQSYENQGISIWLEGEPSCSEAVMDTMTVKEANNYMRDYVFDDGVVREIRFDRINREQT